MRQTNQVRLRSRSLNSGIAILRLGWLKQRTSTKSKAYAKRYSLGLGIFETSSALKD